MSAPPLHVKATEPCHVERSRPKHSELPEAQREKVNARKAANMAQRRGRIIKQRCERCGAAQAEKHHDDYTQPLKVRWLCLACHRLEHASSSPPVCSACRGPRDRKGQQFCRTCHAAYMRAWRVKQRQLVQLARALVKAGKATLPPVTPAGKEPPCL